MPRTATPFAMDKNNFAVCKMFETLRRLVLKNACYIGMLELAAKADHVKSSRYFHVLASTFITLRTSLV
jgi:hypothetical protein